MKRDLPEPRSLPWPAEQVALAVEVFGRPVATFDPKFDAIVSPCMLAVVEARARRADAAFALLGRADAERHPSALLIPHDVGFASLHADPRGPALGAQVRGEPPRRRARVAAGA